ncbi:hypothetical protein EVA_10206 [gut metagenome]|uniref:Uncharacterized protein n=1 Tax=gut metagenome TaxID=749906 RepID=J9G4A7_9ZZZZ
MTSVCISERKTSVRRLPIKTTSQPFSCKRKTLSREAIFMSPRPIRSLGASLRSSVSSSISSMVR